MILHVQIPHANNSLLVKNCTLRHIKPTMRHLTQIVHGEISINSVSYHVVRKLILSYYCLCFVTITHRFFDNEYIHLTNFTITNCKFIE